MSARVVIEGLVAGWAIAIPVGAIGVLILDRAATRGWPTGLAAAMGAAGADFFYAAVAALAGGAAAAAVGARDEVQILSAGVLLGVGVVLLRGALRPATRVAVPRASGPAATAARFFALTVINPVTVIYFTALIAGFDQQLLQSVADRALFAVAAFVASLSWQVALASFGAFAGRRLPARWLQALRVGGAVAVLGFAVRTALRALA